MKSYEAAGIGIAIGVIYGALLWFIKSQIIFIYSQDVAFRIYYDPNLIAFYGAGLTSILCLGVAFSYQSIYSFFEDLALVEEEPEEDDDE
jgi:hypothetical protein